MTARKKDVEPIPSADGQALPASACSPYWRVKGIAMVPAEVEILVLADSEADALDTSISAFQLHPSKRDIVVANSHDDTSAWDFVPHSAHLENATMSGIAGDATQPQK